MKINKTLILVIAVVVVILALIIANTGLNNNTLSDNSIVPMISDLEEHDFDSYFTMDIPKNITFVKSNGTTSGDITLYINYKDPSEKIDIIYAEAAGGKAKLEQAYKTMAEENKNITIKTVNNATILHFNNENIIGENEYHDLAVAGDNSKYVILQCNNESLMNSMAESLKFN